jgi:hypothetical protein
MICSQKTREKQEMQTRTYCRIRFHLHRPDTIQIVAKWRFCVVIGKNTVHFSNLHADPPSRRVKQSIRVCWIASPGGFAMTLAVA